MQIGPNVASPADKEGVINCAKQIQLTNMQTSEAPSRRRRASLVSRNLSSAAVRKPKGKIVKDNATSQQQTMLHSLRISQIPKDIKNASFILKVEAALLDQAIRLNCQDINSLLCIQFQLAGGEGNPGHFFHHYSRTKRSF